MAGFLSALIGELEVTMDKNIITVKGGLGGSFTYQMNNLVGEKNKTYLFTKLGRFEFSFHKVFTFEIIHILNKLMTGRTIGLDVVNIKSAIEQIEKLTAINNVNFSLDRSAISKMMAFTPMKYQEEMYNQYEDFKNNKHYRGMLLDAAPGTGKTFMGLSIAEMVHADKILVICPLSTLNDAWVNSVAGPKGDLVYKEPQSYYTSKDTKPYNNEKIIIFHYEAIDKLYTLIPKIDSKNLVILIDESHNFADSNSKRTLDLLEVINTTTSENVLLLSGTPVKAYATEIINVLRFLDRDANGKAYEMLFKIYAKPTNYFKTLMPLRYQAFSHKIGKEAAVSTGLRQEYIEMELPNGHEYTLPTIKKNIADYIKKREFELNKDKDRYLNNWEICLQEAEKFLGVPFINNYRNIVDKIIKYYRLNNLSNPDCKDAMVQANKIENEILRVIPPELKPSFRDAKTIVKYPMLKIIGECLGVVILGTRIKCHVDLAKNLNYEDYIKSTHKDTIIFSNYIDVCEAAYKKCKDSKFKPVCVYGKETKNLANHVEIFKSDPKANPMIATYKALSTGVRLSNANVILALDLPYRMYIYEQAIARAWRKGQDTETVVYIPVLKTKEPNINQRNFDIITFFNNEVEALTGYKQALQITNDAKPEELVNESFETEVKELLRYDLAVEKFSVTNEGLNSLLLW